MLLFNNFTKSGACTLRATLFVMLMAFGNIPGVLAATPERPMLVRVNLHDRQSMEILRRHTFDVAYYVKGEFADIVADDSDYDQLRHLGLDTEILHEDLVAFYQSRFPVGATMGGFRTLTETLAFMDSLHALYPSITTSRDSVGYSYQGRALWVMKISDNPNSDENEPEFFINGLIHAREPMGQESTLRYMQYLCSNYGTDPQVTDLVDNREFYFMPVINPDGYEYNRQTNPSGGGMWRKNRHSQGIDLNRNWGYMWGYDDNGSSPYPSDETYRGNAPFSEPETQALRQFIESHDFKIAMNFHSYGDYFLYPWGYIDGFTPDQQLLAEIGDSATVLNGYASGTPWELLYNTNGDANDWQYGEQIEKPKIFGFTIEVGSWSDGFWPDPSRIEPLWNQVLPSLLFLSRIAENPYAIKAPAAPVMEPIGDIYGNSFTVRWFSHDTLNPALFFELKELTGFQRITDNLDANSANWNLNGFSRLSARRHSGSYSLFSGAYDNYNATAVLINPVIVTPNDTLRFWTWYSIEQDYDYAYVQLSTDGGATYFNLPGNITTNNNPNGTNLGNGITGNSGAWLQAVFPLLNYSGQSVILGLRYRTDGGVINEGFYADDFYPVETFALENVLNSNIQDTFYAVNGRAEGQYYYQVRAADAQNQWSNFSNREAATVHPGGGGGCTYTAGDANASGAFNGLDVTYCVNYLKGIGPEPPDSCDCPPNGVIFAAADANGNCAFNGLDVTYGVNYLKGIGAAPTACPDCPPNRR